MRRLVPALLLALLPALAIASPATADSYRFWGYYQWDGTAWQFAPTGPADTEPADGDIEGWRFAVSDESASKFPRAQASFESICGGDAAAEGNKRVAVVIDYGLPEDNEGETPPAAAGACAEVAAAASGAEVLAAVAQTRLENGLICAIDSWPASGCGDPVTDDAPQTDESPVALQIQGQDEDAESEEDSDASDISGASIAVGIAAIAGLAAVAILMLRRNQGSDES
jgi:hypothetical protein